MQEVLSAIFGWICIGIGVLMLISLVCFFVSFIYNMATNGGRKWYYYNPRKPWKGGYWAPYQKHVAKMSCQEPNPQRDWNPLGSQEEKSIPVRPQQKRPEWVRFLLEENLGTIIHKRKRKKWAECREQK